MKAQIRVEFIFGVIAFAIIIFFIFSQINNVFTNVVLDSKTDTLKAKAITIINILSQEKGFPPDWNEHVIPLSIRVGLALEPFKLSREKIDKLQNNCDLLNMYELSGYKLTIYDSNEQILFCGYPGAPPITTIVSRNVLIDGGYGNISLELW